MSPETLGHILLPVFFQHGNVLTLHVKRSVRCNVTSQTISACSASPPDTSRPAYESISFDEWRFSACFSIMTRSTLIHGSCDALRAAGGSERRTRWRAGDYGGVSLPAHRTNDTLSRYALVGGNHLPAGDVVKVRSA